MSSPAEKSVGHTPRPWRYDRPTKATPGAWVIDGEGRPICELNDNQSRYAANAHLIAAAPDLYAALVGLFDADFQDDTRPYWDAARAALNKAEGRLP